MCHKESPPNVQAKHKAAAAAMTIDTRRSKPKPTDSTKPLHRTTRTKIRKPKYLSLKLQLSSKDSQSKKNKPKSSTGGRVGANSMVQPNSNHHLKLFPLHPDHDRHRENHDDKDEQGVAFLFENSDGGATTLNGLLGSESSTATTNGTQTVMSSEEDSFSPPASLLSYAHYDHVDNARSLVQTAMRSKDRDAREERWVCYSEVVEKTEQMEEVTSVNSVVSATVKKEKEDQHNDCYYCFDNYDNIQNKGRGSSKTTSLGSLSLKLDYQEILNAWSDKGPLYLDGESPQTVPDLHHEIPAAANFWIDGWGGTGVGDVWRVPESCGVEEGLEGSGMVMSWKREIREASVLRYKEKRQSRLFAKRIRYEVRKLNAEKRPRMKGRFVKRS